MTTAAATYPLDNTHEAAQAHHRALGELLDRFTCFRLGGLRELTGLRCLEVGAGHGSMALWLAEQVGPSGQVMAVDQAPEHIPPHPQLAVLAHDLQQAEWPTGLDGPWDLIHTRLTLGHLPARETILMNLADRLAPGGVVLVQDWAALREAQVLRAPDVESIQLWERYQRTVGRIFHAAGNDHTWAPRVFQAMTHIGLADVDTQTWGGFWRGGGPGCRLVAATIPQLRTRLHEAGFTDEQLQRIQLLLHDPRFVTVGHPLWSTAGWQRDTSWIDHADT